MSTQRKLIILPLLILLIVSACQAGGGGQGPEVARPESGKATVVGRIMALGSGDPLANTTVRLAEVYRKEEGKEEGAFVLDGAFSPGAITDDEGYFVMENIEPMEYVLVVGDVMGVHEIIPLPSGKPRVWEAKSGEVNDFGVINVNLKP